ncbi:MAG: hypothetical protein ABUL72_02775 [Armatimonadota bacterium]
MTGTSGDIQDRFNRLSEVICLATRYGPSPALESEYAELRLWMLGNYKGTTMRWHLADPVENFLAPPTLEGQLNISDERLSQRIESTREALGSNPAPPPQQAVH